MTNKKKNGKFVFQGLFLLDIALLQTQLAGKWAFLQDAIPIENGPYPIAMLVYWTVHEHWTATKTPATTNCFEPERP